MRRYGIDVIGEISLCQFLSLTQVSKILSCSALFLDDTSTFELTIEDAIPDLTRPA